MSEGKAAVISINFDTGEVMHTIFRESDGIVDPVRTCENFRASVGDDFPHLEHHIIANERAREIAGDARMQRWFGIGPEPRP